MMYDSGMGGFGFIFALIYLVGVVYFFYLLTNISKSLEKIAVKFDKNADWYPQLEDEMCTFPRGKHDDQVDSIAYLGLLLDKMVEAPTRQEQEDEEYDDELRDSDGYGAGRSGFTGY